MSGLKISENVCLAPYSTFRTGGPARFFTEPANEEDLKEAFRFAGDKGINVFILGNGSNCLISDKGFDGLVIRLGKLMGDIRSEAGDDGLTYVTAGAGCLLSRFGNFCAELALEGAEFACGIPGTVGGAVFMNAGAYGREIKDIAVSVRYLEDNEIKEIPASGCGFAYRTSIFDKMQESGKQPVILSMKAALKAGDKEKIAAYVAELRQKRTSSQPLDVPSAGSTFKRPEGHFAAKLIEDSGLKGFALDGSGAQVSPKHAGFIVNNNGSASAEDILKLIDYVSGKVFEDSGVRLEREVRLIGEFGGER
ncbi:MAG: UDP-N-acetylmuramate dehydrogenase [Clostridiales bacterium]|nr:UDP-N-acetylmuramate dehydrogenase [Clostridiales bacterium]MBR6488542.1 UDP-N-acetylmuramate dehydrogenase [Clostridiales bacterium]